MSIWIAFSGPVIKEFEADSASVSTSSRPAAGGASRKAQANDFRFTKFNDEISSMLFQHCAQGTIVDRVTIEFYNNKTSALYLTYKLTGVVVSGMQTSGGYRPMDSISLNASSMSWEYFKPSGDP